MTTWLIPPGRAARWLATGVVTAALLAGCAAPSPLGRTSFVLPGQAARLTVAVAPESGYRAQYLKVTTAWDVAEATLSGPEGTRQASADALEDPVTHRRQAHLVFEALPAGGPYQLTLSLKARALDGTLSEVATEERSNLTLDTGENAVILGGGEHREQITVPAAAAGLSGYVTSWPAKGVPARFSNPLDVAFDPNGVGYVADAGNHAVRRFVRDSEGNISVSNYGGTGLPGFLDGAQLTSRFNNPTGLACGADGTVYVADKNNNRVRKLTASAQGIVTVGSVSVTNAGVAMSFSAPGAIAAGPAGVLYVAEANRIFRLVPQGTTFQVQGVAGAATNGLVDGAGADARFNAIADLAVGPSGELYVANRLNARLRRVQWAADGVATVETASNDAVTATAVAVSGTGQVLVGDATRLYELGAAPDSRLVGIAGAGSGYSDSGTGRFSGIAGLAFDGAGRLIVADSGNQRLRSLGDEVPRLVATVAGDGTAGYLTGAAAGPAMQRAAAVASGADGTVYLSDALGHRLYRIRPDAAGVGYLTVLAGTGSAGDDDGSAEQASFNGPGGLVMVDDSTLYVCDVGNNAIRKVVLDADGGAEISTLVTGLSFPGAIALAPNGDLIVAEAGHPAFPAFGSHRVRRVSLAVPAAPVVTTLAGGSRGYAEGAGNVALFSRPGGLAVTADGTIYVADGDNNRIRRLRTGPGGAITVDSLAGDTPFGNQDGQGALARFTRPNGLLLDAASTPPRLVVTDYSSHRIRIVTLDGLVSTLSGAGVGEGFADGPATVAQFSKPLGLAFDGVGGVFVADAYTFGVRRVRL